MKKIPYLALVYIAEELIEKGKLQRDPNNKNNIFVYRFGDNDYPEGWYSQNLLDAMSETYHSKKEYMEFLKVAVPFVDIEKHVKRVEKMLGEKSVGQ